MATYVMFQIQGHFDFVLHTSGLSTTHTRYILSTCLVSFFIYIMLYPCRKSSASQAVRYFLLYLPFLFLIYSSPPQLHLIYFTWVFLTSQGTFYFFPNSSSPFSESLLSLLTFLYFLLHYVKPDQYL